MQYIYCFSKVFIPLSTHKPVHADGLFGIIVTTVKIKPFAGLSYVLNYSELSSYPKLVLIHDPK